MLVKCEFISFLRGIRAYNYSVTVQLSWLRNKRKLIVVEEDCSLRLLCRFDITRELSSGDVDSGWWLGGVWVSPPPPLDRSARALLGHAYSSATLPQQIGRTVVLWRGAGPRDVVPSVGDADPSVRMCSESCRVSQCYVCVSDCHGSDPRAAGRGGRWKQPANRRH